MEALPRYLTEVEPEWFFQNVFPPLKKKHVSRILSKLHDGFTISPKGQPKETFPPTIAREHWRWFSRNPGKMKVGENKHATHVYRHLDDIFDLIITASESVLRKKRIPSTQRLEDIRGLWEVADGEYTGPDTVALWQFTRDDSNFDIQKNRDTLLWKAARSLRCDPRRRFRIGVTFENTITRFWLVSRIGCILSQPFDFIKDHRPLVYYAASTAFATDWELGYDPTVRHEPINGRMYLNFLISDNGNEAWYRTTGGILHNRHESQFLGSGVRVWIANKLDEAGEPVGPEVVLKDYWMPDDARTESEIQEDIFRRAKDARRSRGEPEGDIEKYFMTILHDVPVVFDGQNDSTELFMRTLPSEKGPVAVLRPFSDDENPYLFHIRNSDLCPCNGCRGVTVKRDPRPHIQHRRHRRLVFQEVGSPLEHLSTLPLLFRCLADGVKGLKVLHDAQYVHRDISTGSLLLCQTSEGPICKISDLKCAQPQVDIGSDRPGTRPFMACEVLTKGFDFHYPNYSAPPSHKRWPKFRHNYMHDLESLWWISFYILFYSIPITRAGEINLYVAQESSGNALFLPSSPRFWLDRSNFFKQLWTMRTFVTSLPVEYGPAAAQMAICAKELRKFYESLEEEGAIDDINSPEPYTPIYETILECFEHAARGGYREEIQPTDEVCQVLQRERGKKEVEVEDYPVEVEASVDTGISAPQSSASNALEPVQGAANPAAGLYNLRVRKTG